MKKRQVSDDSLNRIIKYLVITLLGFGIIFIAIQFSDFWNWILAAVKSVIVPIGLAYLAALVVFPIIKYLEKKGVGPRFFSLGIVFVLTAGLIFVAFKYLAPNIADQITNFFNRDFQTIIVYFQTDLRDDFIFGTQIYDQIANYIAETDIINATLDSAIPNLIAGLTSSLIPLLATILLLPILLIFYLLDYEMISEQIRTIIPPKYEKDVAELGSRLNRTVGAYLRGQLSLMIMLGFVATIAYRLIGLKYYLVFGVLVGVTNIIPYFGMIIAAVPPTIYAMIAGTGPGPILVLALNAGLQFVEGNFLQPFIMGKNLSLHPIVVIMSILFFGSLFGAVGVILASPIAASIREFYLFIRQRRKASRTLVTTEGESP
ncbi:MAG: AI-2E family transporter [Bacilli bacterium]|nr:AI-2E family transporter [Bacilli bacterium]MBN2876097.1 AI-2E family transporter [Bacilli bacterium]